MNKPPFRDFISLTDEEIKQIVNDIFDPKKITCIKRHKKENAISCKIYTEWQCDGEKPVTIADKITLRNPFDHGIDSIENYDLPIEDDDYIRLKQFCLAKNIVPWWHKNNPYLK